MVQQLLSRLNIRTRLLLLFLAIALPLLLLSGYALWIAGVPIQSLYGKADHRLLLIIILGLGAACMSITVAYACAGHFTRAINEMVREALSIGRGDLSKRVAVRGGDELALLARAFNQMANNLQFHREHQMMIENISESVRQSLDLNQILNTTVSELGQALSASRCCLALIDATSHADLADDKLLFDYAYYAPERGGTALKNRSILITEDSLLKSILKQGSILSMDVLTEATIAPMFEKGEAYPEDWKSIKSLLACPISTHQRPLGLILIHQCDGHRVWTEQELELVEAVARHVALAMEQACLYAQSKALAEQESLINHIVSAVRSSLNLDTILNTVTRELGEALKVDRCQIAQPGVDGALIVSHEFDGKQLDSMVSSRLYSDRLTQAEAISRFVSGAGAGNDATGNTTSGIVSMSVICDVSTEKSSVEMGEFLEKQGTRSIISAPLLDHNNLLGVLIVQQSSHQRNWSDLEIRLVASIADQVAVAISHAHLFAQVRHQSITDGLTGLYNHVYLKKRLDEELNRAQRRNSCCSLLMVDLDKLKEINDTFGHPVGDAAIRQVARTLKGLLRSGDTAARYGGEEFAIILPDASLPTAALIAQRLCHQINNQLVPGLGRISVSIGAASYPSQSSDSQELVIAADKALYEAKHKGRNQVRTWSADLEYAAVTHPGQAAINSSPAP